VCLEAARQRSRFFRDFEESRQSDAGVRGEAVRPKLDWPNVGYCSWGARFTSMKSWLSCREADRQQKPLGALPPRLMLIRAPNGKGDQSYLAPAHQVLVDSGVLDRGAGRELPTGADEVLVADI
jgi:hypothetical protein